ncbi:MAG: hypothetical protein LQ352_006252 [Teloschistes flavicans]|nr:MAG: hypothetical protein LQ352_006252 [Teloschistes flavicans]
MAAVTPSTTANTIPEHNGHPDVVGSTRISYETSDTRVTIKYIVMTPSDGEPYLVLDWDSALNSSDNPKHAMLAVLSHLDFVFALRYTILDQADKIASLQQCLSETASKELLQLMANDTRALQTKFKHCIKDLGREYTRLEDWRDQQAAL